MARKTGKPQPHNRGGVWYLIRRVPAEYADLDRRGLVRVTTGIAVADDPRAVRATEAVRALGNELEIYWRGLKDGQSAEARLRFEAAQKRARALHIPYQTAHEIAESSPTTILKRIDLLVTRNVVDEEQEVAAVLGGEERPTLRLSSLLDEVKELQKNDLQKMSKNQRRRWENPRRRTIGNLIDVIGDKTLKEITRADTVAFRIWWQNRLISDGLDIGTANKEIGQISKMITLVDLTHQMGLDPIFTHLRIEGGKDKQRVAFDKDWVQNQILADHALDDLNEVARHILYVVADTGLRISEAANLLPEHIHLKAEVPYVEVIAKDRKIKTDQSNREVPLVGTALAAMKLRPNGFPRYRDKEASLSALVNKVLESKKLRPEPGQTFYSLRHTFEDRLTAVEAPEKLIAALMGHKYQRPKYGAGPSLKQKRDWMLKIAFTPPAHLLSPE